MPKSSANVPHSQPSIDRLGLTAESLRGSMADPLNAYSLVMCFEAEASGATFCNTVCFETD